MKIIFNIQRRPFNCGLLLLLILFTSCSTGTSTIHDGITESQEQQETPADISNLINKNGTVPVVSTATAIIGDLTETPLPTSIFTITAESTPGAEQESLTPTPAEHKTKSPTPTANLSKTPTTAEVEIQLSNIRGTSFVVSWTTIEPENCRVEFGEDKELNTTAFDDRGEDYQGKTHYFTIMNLEPESVINYDLICGEERFDLGGEHYQVKLGPSFSSTPSDTAYGQVFSVNGGPAVGVIVYLQLVDQDGLGSNGKSSLMSSLVDENGWWYLNLGNARTIELDEQYSHSAMSDELLIHVVKDALTDKMILVDVAKTSPAEAIFLD